MKVNQTHPSTHHRRYRPSYPNAANEHYYAYRQEKLLDLVTAVVSCVGIVVLLVFLILL